MAVYTGLTSTTKKHLQLDAGALFKGFTVGTDTYATAVSGGKLLGATVGGSTFSATPEVRQVSVDGVKGPTKGFEVFESWTATLTTNLKEVTADSVRAALGAWKAGTTVTGYTSVQPTDVADSHYIDNIVWVGKIVGAADPCMIELKNVLSLNGFNIQVQDKNEGQVAVTFTAHYDPSDLEAVPFEIFIPAVS